MSIFKSLFSGFDAQSAMEELAKMAKEQQEKEAEDVKPAETPVTGTIETGSVSEPTAEKPAESIYDNLPKDFYGVTWLHTDVSAWKVISPLSVTIDNKYIRLTHNKTNWKVIDGSYGNLWIVIDYKGNRYAATCEWLRENQTVKEKKCVNGDHIKRDPLKTWVPSVGEKIGFMVSGLCRDARRNSAERTDVAWVEWK